MSAVSYSSIEKNYSKNNVKGKHSYEMQFPLNTSSSNHFLKTKKKIRTETKELKES